MLLYGSGSRRDEEFSRAVRRVTAGMAQAIAPLIAADIDEEHRLTLAHALVGLAEGASRRLVERGDDFDPDVLARQVSDLAWAGLRGVRRDVATSSAGRRDRSARPQRAARQVERRRLGHAAPAAARPSSDGLRSGEASAGGTCRPR